MADLQISNLPALAEAGIQATDVLALADLSATETKKVTVKDLIAAGAALVDSGDIPAAKVATPFAADAVATATIQNLAVTAAKIANGTITATQIADATITGAKLVNDTVTATQIAANAITASELADDAVDTDAIANLAVNNAKIANTTISYGKLNLSDGDIPGAKLTSSSVTSSQLAADSVGASELANDSVDTAAVVNAAITGAKIASTTIAAGNIVNNTITATQIANGAIGTTQIADGAVTTAKLSGSIEAGTIADGAITTAKLADDAVTSAKIAANAVDAAALANNAVDSGAIASSAVVEAKIAANAVTNGKIADATITPAKLNSSNLDRSINIASGNLGINNTITAATRSGITYNAQGLITGTAALAAGDLPIATTSAVGGVSIASAGGLAVTGAGALSIAATITGATATKVTFNGFGQITGTATLAAGDLPVATASAVGGVSIPTGGPLTVDGNGAVTVADSGVTAGTNTKVTVDAKGRVTALAALADSDLPNHSAALLTSGSIAAARIANDSIDGSKLSNASTAIFQSIAQDGYPTAQFSGQILFDTVSEDAFIWDGNAWQAITTLTKGSLVFGGTYNATTSQMVATTSAGIAAGLAVGSNLPTPSATTDGVYVVVSTSGTPASPAPAIAFAPPDYILGVTNSAGSSWNEVDLSQTVAGQVASNITFTPYGQISSTNVQDALQELETEKLALSGGTVTGQVLIGNTGSLVFEGSTVDAYETTLTVADPTTSDKTITLPNVTGTVITTGDTGTVTGTMLANDTIQNTDIKSDAAIAFTKLADLTAAQILVGNASNEPTAVAVTGDIAITNAGVTSIAAGVIVDADISGSAQITGSKVVTGTTSAVGVLQLTNAADSTSATTAATPAAVKTAKDAADAAQVTADAALPTTGGTLTGNLILDNAKELRLSEGDSDGANYTGLKAQAQTGDITLTLPAVAPTAGQVLKANASTPTTLEWGTDSATDSTKMPLAGGTFTGDVTFTGDSNDVVWDKSASAFTGTIAATAFSGPLTGNVTGNASGSAATVTGAAQSAITSVGTLTGLTVQGNLSVDNGNLTVDATNNRVGIGTASPSRSLDIHSGTVNVVARFKSTDATAAVVFEDDTGSAEIGCTGTSVVFLPDGNEKMRLDSSGRLLLGTTTEGVADGDDLTVATSGHTGITIRSGTSSLGSLYFSDGTSGAAEYAGYVQYKHNTNALHFGSDGGDSLTLDSSHNATFAGTLNAGFGNFFKSTGQATVQIGSGNAGGASLVLDGDSNGDASGGDYAYITHDTAGDLHIVVDNAANTGSCYLRTNGGSYYAMMAQASGVVELRYQNTARLQTSSAGVTVTGTVSDSKGNLRSIPSTSPSSNHVATAADAGKVIYIAYDVHFNPSVFSAGDAVTIVNNSGNDETIQQNSGFTLYNTADGSTGNRTLAGRGMATVWFAAHNIGYISGAGLS